MKTSKGLKKWLSNPYEDLTKNKLIYLVLMIAVGVVCRWLPHPPNFTPILAVSIFFGWRWQSSLLCVFSPLIVMLVSDLVLGLHDTMWIVYATIAVLSLLSKYFKNRQLFSSPIQSVVGMGVLGSVLFFVTTNAVVWWQYTMYPHNLSGLAQSYLAGVPFFHNSLISTIMYLGVFLFIESLVKRWVVDDKTISQS